VNCSEESLRALAVRAVIFVFVLFSMAEVVATFAHIHMSDPFAISALVACLLKGIIIKTAPTPPTVLIVKDSDCKEFLAKLDCKTNTILIANSADEAIAVVKKATPEKPGVASVLKILSKRAK
jgi:hypothetical protein